jgi:thymidylate synthase (FAD)
MEQYMQVELLYCSPLYLVVKGIRKCWRSEGKMDSDWEKLGKNDIKLIHTIIDKGHTSTLEHSLITYELSGISRALLQELSRHRIGVSPSVESTRFTFKKVLQGDDVEDLLISSGDEDIDNANIQHMKNIKEITLKKGLPNDVCKYGLVESYKVNQIISFNLRSLMHFYDLRNSKRALKEIRTLANKMVEILPEDYKMFFYSYFI